MTKRTGAAKKHKGGVLLEDLDSKLDLVLEGQQGLGVRVDEVDKKVDNLKQDMDYKFEIVFDELRLIRNELKEKVGRDEFIVLEKRVAHLEKKTGHRA
jgi:hypothetical protein